MSVTINLLLWPNGTVAGAGSGVRVGLATSLGPVMERDNLASPSNDYPGSPRNVYLMDASVGGTQGITGTADTNSILNITRTITPGGSIVKGYWWDFKTNQWFPAGGDGTYAVNTSPANFGVNVWSPEPIFEASSEVKVNITNFVATAQKVDCPSGVPRLTTALSPSSSINLGQSAIDHATLSGGSPSGISGSVSYFFFSNSHCSGAATPAGTVIFGPVPVGTNPSGVNVNPRTNRIYATNYFSNTVSVIDGTTNTVTATLVVGTNPYDVGVDNATNRVYVANRGSNTVSIIDGSTNTVVKDVTVGSSPVGVGVDPITNRVYVANELSNTVSVIDGNTNTVVKDVIVGGPLGVGVNPATKSVYVAARDSWNAVAVIDENTNTVVKNVTVSTPYFVDVNPTTDRIYATNYFSNTVSVIDGTTNTVTATVNVGTNPNGIGVDPSTDRAYVVNFGSGTVSVINATNQVMATVSVGSSPARVGVNPVTNRAYVSEGVANTVSFIDGSTNTVPTSPGPSHYVHPSTPGGFSFEAVYSGDSNNNGVTSSCEPLAVDNPVGTTGGFVVPVDKLSLLAPYIGMASLVVMVALGAMLLAQRRKKTAESIRLVSILTAV